MLSFDDYKKKYENVGIIGQQLKSMSDDAMQETFDNDIQTRQCYIYDYYHDDQADLEFGYNPALSKTKIPVKLKFIVKTYKSMAKEDPEYHIMFEPDVWNSMSCKPDWFVNNYEKFGIKFPVGLYCDIPDDRGVYHKWLIMYHEIANQFPKLGVLRCNYLFKWIENDGAYRHKRKVWGVDSTQNSYTSGVWKDHKTQTFDDQDKFYLPWSPIVSELRHDTRIVISMLQREPWTYQITKVHNTSPKGIVTFTVKQDRYEPDHDYVQLDPDKEDYGDMYADFYDSSVEPNNVEPNNLEQKQSLNGNISIEAPNYNIKLGASKILTVKIYDEEKNDISEMYKDSKCIWDFGLEDAVFDKRKLIIIDEDYSLKEGNEFKCKFKFLGDEKYLENNIVVTCKIENMFTKVLLDVIAL